jgi:hypothetical protein
VLDSNEFTEEGGYFARVRSVGTADLDMIVDRMVRRGTTVGKADIVAALHLLIEVCIDLILDGWRVDLDGLVRLYCSIGGTFDSPQDRFHRSRHTLKGSAQAGRRLDKALHVHGEPRKQQIRRPQPIPRRFTDLTTDAHDRLTPGGMGRLTGSRLRFNPDADGEGLFLVDQAGQEQRLVVVHNTARQLIFHLPELPPGDYHLEVRARVGNASSPRTGRLTQPLHVIESAS